MIGPYLKLGQQGQKCEGRLEIHRIGRLTDYMGKVRITSVMGDGGQKGDRAYTQDHWGPRHQRGWERSAGGIWKHEHRGEKGEGFRKKIKRVEGHKYQGPCMP